VESIANLLTGRRG